MDLLLIELILWIGLFFLFWALKDGLGHVESDMNAFGLAVRRPAGDIVYIAPEAVSEQIGTYRDKPIFRNAVIEGRDYQYDRIRPVDDHSLLQENERCVEPGLVYVQREA